MIFKIQFLQIVIGLVNEAFRHQMLKMEKVKETLIFEILIHFTVMVSSE